MQTCYIGCCLAVFFDTPPPAFSPLCLLFLILSLWNLLSPLVLYAMSIFHSIHFLPTSTPMASITASLWQLDLSPKFHSILEFSRETEPIFKQTYKGPMGIGSHNYGGWEAPQYIICKLENQWYSVPVQMPENPEMNLWGQGKTDVPAQEEWAFLPLPCRFGLRQPSFLLMAGEQSRRWPRELDQNRSSQEWTGSQVGCWCWCHRWGLSLLRTALTPLYFLQCRIL